MVAQAAGAAMANRENPGAPDRPMRPWEDYLTRRSSGLIHAPGGLLRAWRAAARYPFCFTGQASAAIERVMSLNGENSHPLYKRTACDPFGIWPPIWSPERINLLLVDNTTIDRYFCFDSGLPAINHKNLLLTRGLSMNSDRFRLCYDPETEVVPGVKWGRPEWVPSPAFWLMLATNGTDDDDYVAPRGTSLHHELGFCLLGGYGIKMELNRAAWSKLISEGILDVGRNPTAKEIESLLREPVLVGERMVRYRFPRQKAIRLSGALCAIEDNPPTTTSAREFRRDLMKIPGIGPKTASWLARNWLGSDEVAIIDIHVLRAGQKMRLFKANVRLPGDYDELEGRFLQFAKALSVRASLLDAIIWREMRLLTSPRSF